MGSITMKDLLRQLIQADSTETKGEILAAEVIATYFNRRGIDCRVDQWDGNRANVVAHVKTARKRPALLFVCHLDVVGPGEETWMHPPFAAVEDKGKIYGRGTTDMKGRDRHGRRGHLRNGPLQSRLAGRHHLCRHGR